MRARITRLALLGLLAAACSSSPADVTGSSTIARSSSEPSTSATPTTAEPTPATSAPSKASLVITAAGIGPALLGMTANEIQAALGPDYTVTPQDAIRVDFSGYDIVYGGAVVFSANQSFDGDFIDAFITHHPDVAFANGIGPGTSLSGMVAKFGPGTLAFSYSNEGREFFDFDADAVVPENASIETQLSQGGHAGIYATDDEYNETTEFDPAGEVAAIWLFCTPSGGFSPCPE